MNRAIKFRGKRIDSEKSFVYGVAKFKYQKYIKENHKRIVVNSIHSTMN